ncbi:hypothetical protein QBC40DRAFT_282582 [Triangularia verruculosa]|uniref:Uncharacterized protein n=1 Tax=Triangularia verruculosa TaxID=2587418 RepID=A0AAN6XGH2_9PEZI|nr:hypothetical protein QBC40DRAFT_282582 [Triangularia verruculosa]
MRLFAWSFYRAGLPGYSHIISSLYHNSSDSAIDQSTMIIYPPLPSSPLSPTLPLSPPSSPPRPVVLAKPKSKPQLHTHLHHQTYNSLLSLPLAFSIRAPSALLSPSNLRTALLELILYFPNNRSCTLLRDLDDFFTLNNGCDGISPPAKQAITPTTPGDSPSPEFIAEKIDRLKELLYQWERIIPFRSPAEQEGSQTQHNINDEGWKEWWKEHPQQSQITTPDDYDEEETDEEDIPFVPDHRRDAAIADTKQTVIIGIDESDRGQQEQVLRTDADTTQRTVIIGIDTNAPSLPGPEHRIHIDTANKTRLDVLRSRNHHHRFKTAALKSLLQQFLAQVLQKEMCSRLGGMRNDNTSLEHFLRRREGDCGGR